MIFVIQSPGIVKHAETGTRNLMRSHKARRLSVRVPAIGWEAHISDQGVQNKKVTIGNVSADGAYLITKERYQLDDKVTLSIRSPAIRFAVSGRVVRRDPYGIAVRFIDHSEANRRSLLKVISQYLYKNRPRRSSAEETLKSGTTRSFAAETTVCRESRVKTSFNFDKVCFYNSSVSAAAGCRENSSLAQSSSKGDVRFLLNPAQAQSAGSLKVFLSPCGNATVKCPFCNKSHRTAVPRHFYNKAVRVKCTCLHSFPVLFDNRRTYRKEVRFPGEYWNTCGEKQLMTITTLSASGAGFVVGQGKPSVHSGETIHLHFLLRNNDNIWIKSKAIVKRVDGNQVGVEFIGLNEHQRKCLGFYLMA
jgi:hypothetical protein